MDDKTLKPEEVSDNDFSDKKDEIVTEVKEEIVSEETPEIKEEIKEEVVEEAVEEKPEEEHPDTYTVQKGKKTILKYFYDNDYLKNIELAREKFNKDFGKFNLLKWIIAFIAMIGVICSWIIPINIPYFQTEPGNGVVYYVVFGGMIFFLAILGVFMFISSKKSRKYLDEFLNAFYVNTTDYLFKGRVDNLVGNFKDKLPAETFNGGALYKDVFTVGSRNCLNFTYKGIKVTFSEAAAQSRGDRSLIAVFIGKFVCFDNNCTGEDVVIYRKGGKLALPPTNLEAYPVYENSKDMVIYGGKDARRVLTPAVKQALNRFVTNDTLLDVAINVRAGKTYVYLGYNDDLMVLPRLDPFNPKPTKQLKKDVDTLFDLIDAFGKIK